MRPEDRPTRTDRPGIDLGLLIVLTPILWGVTFPAAKRGLETLPLLPFTAWTRVLGFISVAAVLPFLARHELTRANLKRVAGPGLLLGGLIFAAYLLQTAGLDRTQATNAGFITGLYVVFTPVLGVLLFRRRAGLGAWIAVAASVLGLGFLSITDLSAIRIQTGDALVLGSAVVWAGHLIAVGYFVERHPKLLLSAAQLGATAALHLVATAGEGLRPAAAAEIWHILFLTGILGSGVAYTLQIIAQKQISPTRAAIVLAGESVASAFFSAIWLGERLDPSQWLGAAIIVGAIVGSELSARRKPALRLEPGTAL